MYTESVHYLYKASYIQKLNREALLCTEKLNGFFLLCSLSTYMKVRRQTFSNFGQEQVRNTKHTFHRLLRVAVSSSPWLVTTLDFSSNTYFKTAFKDRPIDLFENISISSFFWFLSTSGVLTIVRLYRILSLNVRGVYFWHCLSYKL